MAQQQILRLPDVKTLSGYSRSTIYLYIANGLFPSPIKIGARSVGWPEDEINQIIRARISGQTENAIKQLVLNIQAARANFTQ